MDDSKGDGLEDGTVTAVLEGLEPTRLLTTYPNPFRGESVIRWSSSAGTPKRIEIFGVDGRWVRQTFLRPGDQSIVWDGRSNTGQRQSAGIYFLRLVEENGRVLASNKVMLLK